MLVLSSPQEQVHVNATPTGRVANDHLADRGPQPTGRGWPPLLNPFRRLQSVLTHLIFLCILCIVTNTYIEHSDSIKGESDIVKIDSVTPSL